MSHWTTDTEWGLLRSWKLTRKACHFFTPYVFCDELENENKLKQISSVCSLWSTALNLHRTLPVIKEDITFPPLTGRRGWCHIPQWEAEAKRGLLARERSTSLAPCSKADRLSGLATKLPQNSQTSVRSTVAPYTLIFQFVLSPEKINFLKVKIDLFVLLK